MPYPTLSKGLAKQNTVNGKYFRVATPRTAPMKAPQEFQARAVK